MDAALTLFFNGSDNLYLDGVAMFATKAWTWIPLYVAVLYVLVREHTFRQFLFVTCCLLLAVATADIVASSIFKPLVSRYRPTHEPTIMHLVDIVGGYRGGTYGFFSSHAANTFAISTYLALLLRHRATTIALYLWALLNCWTRLYLGVHYVGDIAAGILFGIVVGYAFHRLLRYLLIRYARTSWAESPRQHRLCTTLHYSSSRVGVIPTTFLLLLMVITTPWQLFF